MKVPRVTRSVCLVVLAVSVSADTAVASTMSLHQTMDSEQHLPAQKMENDLPDKQSNLRKNRRSSHSSKTARVIVEFDDETGRQHALRLSRRVYRRASTKKYMAIEIETSHIAELAASKGVRNLMSDGLFYEQGFRDKEADSKGHDDRSLFQTSPYGIIMVQADQVDAGKSPVRVCIPDSGALSLHPDLPETIMRGANRDSSFGTNLKWRRDRRGHGTHTAGTVSASDNGYGVRGIGQIPLYITRALNDDGQARESDIIQAIEQCRNSGAKIISLSLGGGGMSSALSDVLTSLYQEGYLIFAASGNNGQNLKTYPAAHPLVVAVGAVMQDSTIWPGSNYGSWLELSAPGKSIFSTTVNLQGDPTYAYYSGTSMATPHVAGVAALVWSHFPECNNNQIRYALAASARDLGASGCDQFFGFGVVQAKDAIDWLRSHSCSDASFGTGAIEGGCTLLQTLSS